VRFEVWAPKPDQVELVLGDERIPMARDDGRDGWWFVEVAGAGAGTRYGFSLDGGPPRPDPRSPSQPEGVDGPSEVVDHDSFPWTDAAWRGVPLPSAVIYELHVGTFTPAGTFDAAIEKLPHLVDLGIDAVELLPVNEFPGARGWGYDGVDLFAPHHAYGGPDGLKRFVDAAHGAGVAVIMDVVYNHLGPAGNYLGEFGPYFTERYQTPWGMAVNLDDRGSDEARRFFLDNGLSWLRDYHCDGLRIDAVHALVDTSALHLLEELAIEVEALSAALGRTLFLIAESDLNDPRIIARPEVGGYGMDAQWSDDFHHALHAVLTGERSGYYADFGSLEQLATALRRVFVHAGEYAPGRDRRHGRAVPEGTPGWRFLGYLQDHDQVGNRAQGERSSHLLSTEQLKIAAALVFTAPFVPMLFMGEEWGATSPFQYFTDHPDPDLGRAVSEGRRSEFAAFGWKPEDVPDPQAAATFERSKLDWDEPAAGAHADLLAWHRELIALRRRTPALTDGRLEAVDVEVDEDAGHLTLRRGRVEVRVNVGDQPWRTPCSGQIILSSPEPAAGSSGFVVVAPQGVVISS
jgi:maltooligosyltrehalose trehalohydrolase